MKFIALATVCLNTFDVVMSGQTELAVTNVDRSEEVSRVGGDNTMLMDATTVDQEGESNDGYQGESNAVGGTTMLFGQGMKTTMANGHGMETTMTVDHGMNSNGDLFIAQGDNINGNVISKNGDIYVEDNLTGTVSAVGDVIIPKNCHVEGDVSATGNIYVYGSINGTVHTLGDVVIGEDGHVVGNVISSIEGVIRVKSHVEENVSATGNIYVYGSINGTVHTQGIVTIHEVGHVEGDVSAAGAFHLFGGINGTVHTGAGFIIYEGGHVEGDVYSISSINDNFLYGSINGTVHTRGDVIIYEGGHVVGNVSLRAKFQVDGEIMVLRSIGGKFVVVSQGNITGNTTHNI